MQTESFLCVSVRFFVCVFKLSGSVFIPPDCHFKKKSQKLASSRETKILEKMRKDSNADVS